MTGVGRGEEEENKCVILLLFYSLTRKADGKSCEVEDRC